MEKYKFALKTPIFIKHEGEMEFITSVSFRSIPEYHIDGCVVYICVQTNNINGGKYGLPIYLPIADSVENFKKKINQ